MSYMYLADSFWYSYVSDDGKGRQISDIIICLCGCPS